MLNLPNRFEVPDRPWTESEVALLGRRPDKDLATHLGRTLKAVQSKREFLRIPNRCRKVRDWTAQEIGLLRDHGDAEVGRLTGRTKAAIRYKRSHMRIPFQLDKRPR